MLFAGSNSFSGLPEHLSIEIHSTIECIQGLKSDWQELEARSKDVFTYFQTYNWCEQWCQIYARNTSDHDRRKLFVVTIKNNGKLAAVLPLVIERRSRIVKVLRFLGEPLIQYGNILIDSQLLSPSELTRCWEKIKTQAECDAIVLDRFVSNTPLCWLFPENQRYQSNDIETSMIDVRHYESGEAFVSSQSRAKRKSRNRKRRKLEALGEVSFEVVEGNNPHFTELVKIAMQMKVDWLSSSGRSTGAMRDIRTLQLLSVLQAGNGKTSGAIAMSYSLNGKPIAIEIGFCHKQHYYSFIGAFDWQMHEFSPGKLQLEHGVKWAIENGFKTYDFLGNPSQYKDSWTDRHIPVFGFSNGKTLLGMIYANYWKPSIRPAIKTIFSNMPVPVRQKIVGISLLITSRK